MVSLASVILDIAVVRAQQIWETGIKKEENMLMRYMAAVFIFLAIILPLSCYRRPAIMEELVRVEEEFSLLICLNYCMAVKLGDFIACYFQAKHRLKDVILKELEAY